MSGNSVLGVHSIGEFVLGVPKLEEAEIFYKSFGLNVSQEGNHLAVRAPGSGSHPWARLIEARRKFLHHVTFHCFENDLSRFKTHLETQRVSLVDPPSGFGSDGLWFRGHDGILMEIRVGPKTSPNELSKIIPPSHEPGVANGFIQPLHGVRSKTTLYSVFYALSKPLTPLLRFALPKFILTTEEIGRAMIALPMSLAFFMGCMAAIIT